MFISWWVVEDLEAPLFTTKPTPTPLLDDMSQLSTIFSYRMHVIA